MITLTKRLICFFSSKIWSCHRPELWLAFFAWFFVCPKLIYRRLRIGHYFLLRGTFRHRVRILSMLCRLRLFFCRLVDFIFLAQHALHVISLEDSTCLISIRSSTCMRRHLEAVLGLFFRLCTALWISQLWAAGNGSFKSFNDPLFNVKKVLVLESCKLRKFCGPYRLNFGVETCGGD